MLMRRNFTIGGLLVLLLAAAAGTAQAQCPAVAPQISLAYPYIGPACPLWNEGFTINNPQPAQTYTVYENGQPVPYWINVPVTAAGGGNLVVFPTNSANAPDSGAFWVVTYSTCGDSAVSNTVYNYPSGIKSIATPVPADTSVTLSWTTAGALAQYQSYQYTITQDSSYYDFNQNQNFTYITGSSTDTFATAGGLLPNTHYYLFINNSGCLSNTDSTSFTTTAFQCGAHTLQPGILGAALYPCEAGAFFGMADPSIYQQYTFLLNRQVIDLAHTNMPGSGSKPVSFPIESLQQSAAGAYQVVTTFAYPGCTDSVYGPVQYYYYAGVLNLAIQSLAGGTVRFNWIGQPPFDTQTPNQYTWAISADSLIFPDSVTTTTDTFAVATGLQPGHRYFLYVNNISSDNCNTMFDTLSFVWNSCGVAPPALSLTGGACAAANTALAVSGLTSGETFTLFRNSQPMPGLTRVDSAVAQNGYTLLPTDTAAFFMRAYDICGDSVSSDTVYNYNAGVFGLALTHVSDTLVSFMFNAAVPGDTYIYTITTDPANTDPTRVVDQLHVLSLSDTAGQLQPGTKYYLFVGDSVCNGTTDSVSFTTMPYDCSHQLLPVQIPDNQVCQDEPSFGLPVTSVNQQYTFLHNNQVVMSRPGSGINPVSYPVPYGQQASGAYQVITFFPNCPQVDSSNVEYWWFGGVGNLGVTPLSDTSVRISWLTAQENSQYQWGIGTDSLNVPDSLNTTSDTTAFAGGLTPNTKYYLYVTNLTVSDCQFEYDTLSFTTPATSSIACGLSGLTTTNVSSNQASFHWTSVSPGQTYAWVVTTDPANSQPNLVAAQGTATDTFAVATGLTPATAYYIFVDDQACAGSINTFAFSTAASQSGGGSSPCSPGSVAVPTISHSGPLTFCTGDSVVLVSSAASGNQWYSDADALSSDSAVSLIVRTTGSYSVRVTDTAGCLAQSAPVVVTVISVIGGNEAPTIFPPSPVVVCDDTISLLAANAVSFQWYLNGKAMPGQNSGSLIVTRSGSYTVTTDSTACSVPSAPSAPVVVTMVASTTPSISAVNGVLVSDAANNNQWYVNDSLIAGATQQDYTPVTPGTYTVRLTIDTSAGLNGVCYGPFSSPYQFTDSAAQTPNVQVYPNPITNLLTLHNQRPSPATVRIVNLLGQQMVTITGLTGTQQLDVAAWGLGTYLIEIIDEPTHKKTHVEILKL